MRFLLRVLVPGAVLGGVGGTYWFLSQPEKKNVILPSKLPGLPSYAVDQSTLEALYKKWTPTYADKGHFAGMKEEEQAVLGEQVWAQYGEMSFEGTQEIINTTNLQPDDVFYDLGSGVGNVCAQIFLNSQVGKVKGVEFVPSRHKIAEQVGQDMKQKYPDRFRGRSLEFSQGNILHYSLSDATVVFMCSWCFDDPLLAHVARAATNCGGLRYLISLRPLPNDNSAMGQGLFLHKTVPVPCDWSPNKPLPLYFYTPHMPTINTDAVNPRISFSPTSSSAAPSSSSPPVSDSFLMDSEKDIKLKSPDSPSNPATTKGPDIPHPSEQQQQPSGTADGTGPEGVKPPASAPTGGLSINDPRLRSLPIAINSYHARV